MVSPAADAVAALVVALATLILAPPPSWLWAVLAMLATGALFVLWRGIHGASLGHALLKLRTIDAVTGLPSFRFAARRAVVERGSAADPYALRPRPMAEQTAAPPQAPVAVRRSYLRLEVDDGTAHTVTAAALIGRNPTAPPDPRYRPIAIPDLTRTISKAHFLVGVSEDGIAVTDLGSANGTWVDGSVIPLTPRQTVLVAWGSKLHLGERSVVLARRIHETPEGRTP